MTNLHPPYPMTNLRPPTSLNFPISMLHCRAKHCFENRVHSDEEILQEAVDRGDIHMMAFMHDKGTPFDADQLILIAVMKMMPSVIMYLCIEMKILPSKLAILRCLQRARTIVEDFDRGGSSTTTDPRSVHRSVNTLMWCRLERSGDILQYDRDPEWVHVLDRLLQIDKIQTF